MKSLERLLGHVLRDCGTRCSVDPTRDIISVASRVEHEGLGFLTMTLPDMGSAIDRALSCGFLPTLPAFKARRGLPLFLGGFLRLVFHEGGKLRDDASIDAIASLRQICNLVKKVRLECSRKRQRKAVDAYVACEDEVSKLQTNTLSYETTLKVGRIVIGEVLRQAAFGDVRPHIRGKHGPGATSERILGNRKYVHESWFTRLDDAGLTFEEFGMASLANLGCDDTPDPKRLGPDEETPVRVVFVPKTAKAPRVIAIEPVCMQFMQQAILQWLVPRIEQCAILGGAINFTSQEKNRTACRLASVSGSRATLDLSEASDRVPWVLIKEMLAPYPEFLQVVAACRSERAHLPDGRYLTSLSKFASMGSALCFPFEAIVFFSAIVAARLIESSALPTGRNIRRFGKGILVYGDDLVIPTRSTDAVTQVFDDLKFVVNRRKSFTEGHFRESCGEDYFSGHRVTPVYVREVPTGDRRNATGVISTVSLANQLYEAGYWGTARYVRELVERELGTLPHVARESAGLGWRSCSNRTTIQRWNNVLHRFEYRGWSIDQRYESSPLNGDPALFKALERLPNGDRLPIEANASDEQALKRQDRKSVV